MEAGDVASAWRQATWHRHGGRRRGIDMEAGNVASAWRQATRHRHGGRQREGGMASHSTTQLGTVPERGGGGMVMALPWSLRKGMQVGWTIACRHPSHTHTRARSTSWHTLCPAAWQALCPAAWHTLCPAAWQGGAAVAMAAAQH
eukprot:366087-Chlamydomonas_euryale.AAC.10